MCQQILRELGRRWKLGVAAVSLLAVTALFNEQAGAMQWSGSHPSDSGTITISGTVTGSIQLTVSGVTTTDHTGATCFKGSPTTLGGVATDPANTLALGTISATCPTSGNCGGGNYDCYTVAADSGATYVASLSAQLVLGADTSGLEVYAGTNGWDANQLKFGNSDAIDWSTAINPAGTSVIPTTPDGTTSVVLASGTGTRTARHQLAIHVVAGSTAGAHSATVTYHTF